MNESSIAKKEIPLEAYNYGSYNGFLYSYTLIKDVKSPIKPYNILPKGKCYIGAHGSDKLDEKNCNVDDGYWQSCKSEEFRLLFSGTEPVFEFKVWYLCKNWSEAKNEENRVLKEFDNEIGAAKSDMSWNQHNGFPTHIQIDREACKEMVTEILKRENCKWKPTYADKSGYTVGKLARIQVRAKDYNEHKKDIRDRINDVQGNVKLEENPNIDPTVILENRHPDGRDQLIDGNMTSGAICDKKCLADFIPEIRIPLKDHEHLTDDEVRHTSNILNRKGKKIKKPIIVEDAIKFILSITKNGEREYDTKFNRRMIKEDYDLSSAQVADVMKGVKDSIFEEKQRKVNMVLPDYNDQDKQDKVDELKKVFPDEIIFYCAVSIADKIPYKILENIDKDVQESQAEIPKRDPFKKIRIVVHYSQSKSLRDYWIRDDTGGWVTLQKFWKNIKSPYTINYEEMPISVPDTK
tara:strand:- start:78 stop:1469 length:1392 start_codon:yes stop_codon:yes gene_type:complete